MGLLADVQQIATARPDSVFERRSSNGFTALHYAAKLGHTAMVSFLVNSGADLYAEDVYGRWPVDISYGRGNQIATNILEKATYPENRETRFDMFDDDDDGGAPVQPIGPKP